MTRKPKQARYQGKLRRNRVQSNLFQLRCFKNGNPIDLDVFVSKHGVQTITDIVATLPTDDRGWCEGEIIFRPMIRVGRPKTKIGRRIPITNDPE